MSTNVLDSLVGDLLPHVHIKKIIVEDHSGGDGYTYDVTMQMELYQKKSQLLKSSWLSDVDLNLEDDEATSIFDFLRLNIVAVQSDGNLRKLEKSNPRFTAPHSLFVHKQTDAKDQDPWSGVFNGTGNSQAGKSFKMAFNGRALGDPFAKKWRYPLHIGALIGLTQTDYEGNPAVLHGVREELYEGELYYIIPYQHKFGWKGEESFVNISGWEQPEPSEGPLGTGETNKNNLELINGVFYDLTSEKVTAEDLGVVAYTSLELREALGLPLGSVFQDALNLEGSVSAEVVLRGSKPVTTREAFVDFEGQEWHGAVHYHRESDTADGYVGYMVGQKHRPGVNQPKLAVINKPNIIISDMTDPIQQKVPNEMISLDKDGNPVVSGKDATSNVSPNYENIKEVLSAVGGSLQAHYQKETLKDVYKNSKDNDSEYSKLYLTRDESNSARGMFFIDLKQLILNNSHYIQYFRPEIRKLSEVILPVLEKSRIIDMTISRRRVHPQILEKTYKTFSVNTPFEEPVEKIACAKDLSSFKASTTYLNSGAGLREVNFNTKNSPYTRYFSFSDEEVGRKKSGYYQYEVKLDFFDGAAVLMHENLANMRAIKKEIDDYYKLASSSEERQIGDTETIEKLTGAKSTKSVLTKKFVYKPYYDNNYKKYLPEFSILASERFVKDGEDLSVRAAKAAALYYSYFSTKNLTVVQILNTLDKVVKMLSPGPVVHGSPDQIMLCSRIFATAIENLEKILLPKTPKKENNSNILQSYASPSDQQALPDSFYEKITPSLAVISEEHTFDHPREIFKSNENIRFYVDYHATDVFEAPSNFWGVKTIMKDDFAQRCYLELLKYSPYATSQEAVHGSSNSTHIPFGGAIPRVKNDGIPFKDANGTTDKLSNTMFSYLSPSVINLSYASQTGNSFNFTYKMFSNVAKSTLAGEYDPIPENIYEPQAINSGVNNTALLLAGMYMKSVEENKNYDKMQPFVIPRDILEKLPVDPSFSTGPLVQSHAYKNFFSNYNITVHHPDMHEKVFGSSLHKIGGAFGQPDVPGIDEFPLDSTYFTDADLFPVNFFTGMVASEKQGFLTPPSAGSFKPFPYSVDLPNCFKLSYVRESFIKAQIPPKFLNGFYENLFKSDESSPERNGLKFFNFNMVAKIEKLSGHGNSNSTLAIDDSWEILTESDLTSGTGALFCRITYYDSSLVRGCELPIVNQYFMLGEPLLFGLDVGTIMDLSSTLKSAAYFQTLNTSALGNLKGALEKTKIKNQPAAINLPAGVTPIPTGEVPAGGNNSGGDY